MFVYSVTVKFNAYVANAVMSRAGAQPAAGGATPASRKARLVRLPPRVVRGPARKNKRQAEAAPVLTDNLSEPITAGVKLEPGQFLLFTVQFTILQENLDVNQPFIVTPDVIAKGPANLNQLTTSQLNAERWLLNAEQRPAMDVTVAPMQLQSNPPHAGKFFPLKACSVCCTWLDDNFTSLRMVLARWGTEAWTFSWPVLCHFV